MTKQVIILGSPEYFSIEDVKPEFDRKRAEEQFARFKKHIESHNIQVKVVPGSKEYYDSIYITDTAIIVNDFAIMARYHKPSRRGEEIILAEYLKTELGLRIRYLPEEDGLYFEGGGDTRWSHQNTHVWFGYGGGRTTLKGIEAVSRILQEELGSLAPTVHTLRTIDRKTFHLDLAFLPLANGRALYYPTLAPSSVKEIQKVFGEKNVVKVPAKYFFACNSVALNDKYLLIPKLPYTDYRAWMYKATQMKLDEVNINQFHLGNGSVQCITLQMITALHI
jgi:N-dimethylarginine dimethylaminohydrolase